MSDQPRYHGSPLGWDPWAVVGSVARDPHRAPPPGALPHQGGGSTAPRSATPGTSVSPIEQDLVGLLLSGNLDTEIRRRATDDDAERYRWSFAPGIERAEDLRSIPLPLRAALVEVHAQLVAQARGALSLSWADGDRRHHLAPGRTTLAAVLAVTQDDLTPVRRAGRALGSALRALADARLDPAGLSRPAGPARLAHWLRTGDGPFAAAIMHEVLTTRLGPARVAEVLGWIDGLEQACVVTGRGGLESTVVSESAAPPALLLGDEIAAGPEDLDLAWTLGELVVLESEAAQLPHELATHRRDAVTACRDEVLMAYGPTTDLIRTGRMTCLRVLLELHDAAAFQDTQLEWLAAEAPELVDDAR